MNIWKTAGWHVTQFEPQTLKNMENVGIIVKKRQSKRLDLTNCKSKQTVFHINCPVPNYKIYSNLNIFTNEETLTSYDKQSDLAVQM